MKFLQLQALDGASLKYRTPALDISVWERVLRQCQWVRRSPLYLVGNLCSEPTVMEVSNDTKDDQNYSENEQKVELEA